MIYKWLLYDTRWCGVRSQGSSVRECCGVTIPWVHIVARPCNYKVLPHCWLRYGAIAKCCWIVERLWAPAVSIHPFLPTLSNFHLCGLLSNFHSAPEESQFKLNLFRKSGYKTNGELVESSNGNGVTKIVTKRLFSIEIGLVTAKEVTRNSYTALSTKQRKNYIVFGLVCQDHMELWRVLVNCLLLGEKSFHYDKVLKRTLKQI